jgi:ribonuclease HI
MENVYMVYTDGAVRSNNTEGTSAFIIVNDDKIIDYWSERKLNDTISFFELNAIKNALIRLLELNLENEIIYIKSDSNYSVKSLTEHYKKWIKNGWRTSGHEEVIHKELFIEILDLIAKFKTIYIQHIKSHDGNFYNEVADKICNQAYNIKFRSNMMKKEYRTINKGNTILKINDENIKTVHSTDIEVFLEIRFKGNPSNTILKSITLDPSKDKEESLKGHIYLLIEEVKESLEDYDIISVSSFEYGDMYYNNWLINAIHLNTK